MPQDNSKKTENTSGTNGVEQPLMTTGTTEPGFDWDTGGDKSAAKPKIGETLMGETVLQKEKKKEGYFVD
ncbi:hypothetical protein ACFOU2_21230 [Bacillus songklensis]|uniref:Uncharacterized protein n=1 Tax=Bacillus songklensis TaxID=1069116 RepID=A0ABV8B6D9_9BACI